VGLVVIGGSQVRVLVSPPLLFKYDEFRAGKDSAALCRAPMPDYTDPKLLVDAQWQDL
jgi:hypothetical protein